MRSQVFVKLTQTFAEFSGLQIENFTGHISSGYQARSWTKLASGMPVNQFGVLLKLLKWLASGAERTGYWTAVWKQVSNKKTCRRIRREWNRHDMARQHTTSTKAVTPQSQLIVVNIRQHSFLPQISHIGLGNDQSQNHRDSRPEISSQYWCLLLCTFAAPAWRPPR